MFPARYCPVVSKKKVIWCPYTDENTIQDLCSYLKLESACKESSLLALQRLSDETMNMSSAKVRLSIDAPWCLVREQIEQRCQREIEEFESWRHDCLLPMAMRIPVIDVEIRTLFEEAAFLEVRVSLRDNPADMPSTYE